LEKNALVDNRDYEKKELKGINHFQEIDKQLSRPMTIKVGKK